MSVSIDFLFAVYFEAIPPWNIRVSIKAYCLEMNLHKQEIRSFENKIHPGNQIVPWKKEDFVCII